MNKKICINCGEEIHPLRIKALPLTNVCVNCSNSSMYSGTPIQLGEGDHTYNELVIHGKNKSRLA